MKIALYTKDLRLRASPTAGRKFFEFLVTDPPRGRPFGGGGNHRTRSSDNNYHIKSEYYDLHGKCSITS